MRDFKGIVASMTLDEKASLCSGLDFWHTKPVDRLGIPSIMMCDGPHGLRKQELKHDHMGINIGKQAVCYPTACATACSFDPTLLERMGNAIGEECLAEGIDVLLGPAANIKRSPLCGRNFEYYSEDPFLSSRMAAGFINGVQARGVGTCLKHICANNQESRRMTVDVQADMQTLREIYLASFEYAVRKSAPWTVMCAYNRVNGCYGSENAAVLTETLRNEWGFEGTVISDWGAVNDRVRGMMAGLDLEMPSSNGENDQRIVRAVRDGKLDEQVLNRTVERLLKLIFNAKANEKPESVYDKEQHHALARDVARECMVLLKNGGDVLPLSRQEDCVFIGPLARSPRYQGGGSSHINAYRVSGAYQEAVKKGANVRWVQGYEGKTDSESAALIEATIQAAARARVAVIFAGLPETCESEGFDRGHMRLPEEQVDLIRRVGSVQPRTVVVLHNGSPVEMPWIDRVAGVLEAYLGGEGTGEAVCDLLYGDAVPCGRLAETFPLHENDNPSCLNFPGERDVVRYREGIFVGYRYYDKKEMSVLFPFGYGLSYTRFKYADLRLASDSITDSEELIVRVNVGNVGTVAAKEVVQLYVGNHSTDLIRPPRELKGFTKLELKPGEAKDAVFVLDRRSFAYYDASVNDWVVESGTYSIEIGRSSRDIVLSAPIMVRACACVPVALDMNSTLSDLFAHCPGLESAAREIIGDTTRTAELSAENREDVKRTMQNMPLHALVSAGDGITHEQAEELLRVARDAVRSSNKSGKASENAQGRPCHAKLTNMDGENTVTYRITGKRRKS